VREALEIARAGALAGGRALRDRAGAVRDVHTKSTAIDFVTDADIAAGVAVAGAIARLDRDARFVSEEPEVYALAEVVPGALDDDRVWVIDPLDGTTSYLHGYPCYSVSVALLEAGRPVVGAIYNAAVDELTSAALGMGATRDLKPISIGHAPTVGDALLITGFPYDRGETLTAQLELLDHFVRNAHGIRRDGSAAVDLAHIAAGRADGFWELGLQPWDMAAGVIIVSEAGGAVTDVDGSPWTTATRDVVAANPRLHEQMLAAIAAVRSRA